MACALLLCAAPAYSDKHLLYNVLRDVSAIVWPAGTKVLSFENIEGIILLRGTLQGLVPPDTTGPLALDTGAGYLALDVGLARTLGIADSVAGADAVDLSQRPLPRLTIGGWSAERLEPVLTVDGEVVRRVSDRPVLGLIGQRPLGRCAVWIDYRAHVLALIPAADHAVEPGHAVTDTLWGPASGLAGAGAMPGATAASRRGSHAGAGPDGGATGTSATGTGASANGGATARDSALTRSRLLLAPALSASAIPVPFRLLGDGKILVRGAVSDPSPPAYSRPLNLLIDTGATKCVLFEDSLAAVVKHADAWPALRGLAAPTLIGTVAARIARVPVIELETTRAPLGVAGVDVGVIRSDLSQVLTHVTHEQIHGLIGYSFLKRFRLALDYPNRVLWLDSIPGYRDDRPNEYCHVGLQLEREGGAVMVTGVVEGSPAEGAGIRPGDEVVALDGADAHTLDLLDLTRRMEGDPGRPLTLVMRRNATERTVRLVRRRLL